MPRLTAAILIAGCSATAAAQCPDGSPPPCRTQTVAAATSRRVNPPLDDRTWIVVPFDNLRKIQEIDWLRGASVNLLYLDMSRWRDIRVIDDERVADLLREVPEARDTEKLDLNAGLAIAKRAGAGRLVMGDLLQLGNRTAVTAKVYDVRSGQRLRSVQEAATAQDSVMPMFSKLAQKILNVAPPAGSSLGAVGTTSVAAYQEYLQGVQALSGFRITEARQFLERALQLDSTFALAHFKLSIVNGWDDSGDPRIRTHADAAARLSTALPARVRSLISGHALQSRREFGSACDAFAALLRADSSDVDAWYGLGDCRFHDNVAEPVVGDTTRVRFRGDLNESIRAFRRALELDPTNHLAYQHIVDGYLAEIRAARYCVENRCTQYLAIPVRSGDSLLFTPAAIPRDTAKLREQFAAYARAGSRRRNIASAVAAAEQWVTASPEEDRAHAALAGALLAAGRIDEARAHIERAALRGQAFSAFNSTLVRVEILGKSWRGSDARRAYDSARVSTIALRNNPSVGSIVSLFGPLFGRMTEFDSLVLGSVRQLAPGPAQQNMFRGLPRLVLGLSNDSAALIERAAFDEGLAAGGAAVATRAVTSSLTFGLNIPRATWPALDTTLKDAVLQPAIALFLGDTGRLRRTAVRLDSMSAGLVAALMPDTGVTLVAANAYLAARDSAGALRMARRMLDSVVTYTPLVSRGGGYPYAVFIPRAMVLRADLAAALGHADEARLWYKRFLDMWATASPAYQPLVERVRKSYAAIGGT